MSQISFGTAVESMGPYYCEADLNDSPVTDESFEVLEAIIKDAEGSIACELKEDGFRCQAQIDGNNLILFSRGSSEFEIGCFPEIVDSLKSLNLDKTIFDGELRGASSKFSGFKAIQSRARYKGRIGEKSLKEYLRSKPEEFPLQFVVFDVLMNKGIQLINEKNSSRRDVLEELVDKEGVITKCSRQIVGAPEEILELYKKRILKEKYEGLVLKQPFLEYIPGDKTHWVKLKRFEPLDLVVLGLSKVESKEVEFGQALVGSYDLKNKVYQSIGFVSLLRSNPATQKLFAEDILKTVGKKISLIPENVQVGSKKPNVYVNPAVVLEIRAMNIEFGFGKDFACSTGKGSYSLRIAYVKSIRDDKRSDQSTTTEFVEKYYKLQR